jgi:hypothetical protein
LALTISRLRRHVVITTKTTAAIANGSHPPWTTFVRFAAKRLRP